MIKDPENKPDNKTGPIVSLGLQLKNCPRVITLGARASLLHYNYHELEIVKSAQIIFFPTLRFVDIFLTAGKKIYPSAESYLVGSNTLKQIIFFKLLNVPHPRSLICMSREGMGKVLSEFSYPFVGINYKRKNKSKSEYLIKNMDDLIAYLKTNKLCLFREAVSGQNLIKVVVIDSEIVVAYECTGHERSELSILDEHVGLPMNVENVLERILSSSKLNHFVAEFVWQENNHLLTRLNYVLPIRELNNLGFDPYKWLCSKIISGKFSYFRLEGE